MAILFSLTINGWASSTVKDLTQLSLEDLMRIEVTSVSNFGVIGLGRGINRKLKGLGVIQALRVPTMNLEI